MQSQNSDQQKKKKKKQSTTLINNATISPSPSIFYIFARPKISNPNSVCTLKENYINKTEIIFACFARKMRQKFRILANTNLKKKKKIGTSIILLVLWDQTFLFKILCNFYPTIKLRNGQMARIKTIPLQLKLLKCSIHQFENYRTSAIYS